MVCLCLVLHIKPIINYSETLQGSFNECSFLISGSQKSVSLEDSIRKEYSISYGKNSSFVRNLSIKAEGNNTSLPVTTSSEGKGQVAISTLKTPPGRSAPEPPQPPPPPPALAPRPPPPPKASRPPPAPPKPVAGRNQPTPLGPLRASEDNESDAQKPKLKPFFWDKVAANPDHAMVWHEIRAGSFQ